MRSGLRSGNALSTSSRIRRPAALPLSFCPGSRPSRTASCGSALARSCSALANGRRHPVRPGDRVCVLGFTSVDYATIDMALVQLGAVSVPLQTSAPVSQLRPIVAETEPRVFASSVYDLGDAVELVLTGHVPARLVVFDYRPEVDEQREAFDAARTRLAEAGSPVLVETLADLLERGESLPAAPEFVPDDDDDDPLRLLIYTSGSTGAPKGAMYPERLVANFWRRSRWNWGASSVEPTITLSFMPMSHVMGRGVLYGTLGNGGTAYFTARSDLSTLFEDLALVRPTELNFVPRIWDMLFQRVPERSGPSVRRRRRSRGTRSRGDGGPGTEPARRTVRLGDDGLRTDLGRGRRSSSNPCSTSISSRATARPRPGSSTSTARCDARR